jgi:GrpB-like predicted nucleotidyltransferase (UPF0157 family)
MLGLKHNVNLLADYDPEWAVEFSKESNRIANALGGLAKGIEHYGSTAVIEMRATPIIDIRRLEGVQGSIGEARIRLRCKRRCSGASYIWPR